MLVFATVAALVLTQEWDMSYAQMIPYATPGFIAFGLLALPAGWVADKWNREGMILVFFFGIGASSVAVALAQSPAQIGIGLFFVGCFGAIYHPVGIPLIIEGHEKTGLRIAVNGVFGNLGVASAALLTGYLIDQGGWRLAFVGPGLFTMAVGVGYAFLLARKRSDLSSIGKSSPSPKVSTEKGSEFGRSLLIRIFVIVLVTTALGSLVFQATTFTLPKVFDERLGDLSGSATLVGFYVFSVVAIASIGQLLVGYLLDRLSIKMVFLWVAMLQIGFFLAMMGRVGITAMLIGVGFMLAVFGQIPINDVLLGKIIESKWRSRAYGLRYVIGFSVMSSAIPLIAWIHTRWGFDMLFLWLAVASVAILISVLMLPRRLVFFRSPPRLSP